MPPPPQKMFLVQWQAVHALLLSLLDYWWNGSIAKHLWVDQKGESQKEPYQHYAEDASAPQSSVGRGIRLCRGMNTTVQHLSTTVLGVWLWWLVSADPKAFRYIGDCLLLFSSLCNVPELILVHSKDVSTSLFLLMVMFWTSFWLAVSHVMSCHVILWHLLSGV